MVESPGWDRIIGCLGRDSSISKAAIELLYELLQDRSGWNVSVCKKFSQQCSSTIFLVTLLKGPVKESAEIAERILMKLFDIDEENISRAAKSGWYKPLIDHIVQGNRIHFFRRPLLQFFFLVLLMHLHKLSKRDMSVVHKYLTLKYSYLKQ